MHLPIGYDNFGDVIEKKLDFVDKTLFIKEVLDNIGTQVTVVARPRRFGKTLNLSMLQYFLSAEVRGHSTKGLFDGLKIAAAGDAYMQHQGRYPVIFLTFKAVKDPEFESAYESLGKLLSQLYREYKYLLSSEKLSVYDKKAFLSVIEVEATPAAVKTALADLCYYLYQHHGVKAWILIDEYDTFFQTGYLHGYYSEMIELMRGLFGNALKTNPYLERAFITGILRVSKESLFSGANNIIVYSIMDTQYSQHFGFTDTEVKELLEKAHLSNHYDNIRRWYNGYQIGNTIIYNPWSLINCVQNQGLLKPYWVNTSGNDLVKHLLARGSRQLKMDLESVIHNESITALIDENLVFSNLENDKNAIWSLLLFSGYFKVIHVEAKRSHQQCELAVPNLEVLNLYQDIIRGWLAEPLDNNQYLEFLLSLTEGRVEEFEDRLQKYLLETMSIFDASGHEPEKFYHGFVLGMMVSLSDTHEVKSNHESGYGRYDVLLIPKDPEQLGIILEFKTAREKKITLRKAADDALRQINERQYSAELWRQGIHKILKIGLAFRGKHVCVVTEAETYSEIKLPDTTDAAIV
jgi:hypothetical protein